MPKYVRKHVDEICGQDGEIRVAKVKTPYGTLVRALQRLYPLEIPRPAQECSSKTVVGDKELDETELLKPPEIRSIKTRAGRVVEKPIRYGQWSYLVLV